MNWLSDPGLWAFLNFALLVWLILRFGGRPIANLFRKRQEEVESSVINAENALAQAQKTLSEARQIQSEEPFILERVHAGARTLAATLALDVDREAKEEAEHIRIAANSEAERERHALLSELRSTVVNEAIALAESRIVDDLNRERHLALFDAFTVKAAGLSV